MRTNEARESFHSERILAVKGRPEKVVVSDSLPRKSGVSEVRGARSSPESIKTLMNMSGEQLTRSQGSTKHHQSSTRLITHKTFDFLGLFWKDTILLMCIKYVSVSYSVFIVIFIFVSSLNPTSYFLWSERC